MLRLNLAMLKQSLLARKTTQLYQRQSHSLTVLTREDVAQLPLLLLLLSLQQYLGITLIWKGVTLSDVGTVHGSSIPHSMPGLEPFSKFAHVAMQSPFPAALAQFPDLILFYANNNSLR